MRRRTAEAIVLRERQIAIDPTTRSRNNLPR
jgi:hypothetical protein